jgi:Antibiotic biosynthesis monooxygenase
MHTSIRHYHIKPGSADEIARRVETGFVPLLTQSPGFISYNVVDVGNNTLVAITTFESQADEEMSNTTAASWVRENVAQFVTEPPTTMSGNVSMHKMK